RICTRSRSLTARRFCKSWQSWMDFPCSIRNFKRISPICISPGSRRRAISVPFSDSPSVVPLPRRLWAKRWRRSDGGRLIGDEVNGASFFHGRFATEEHNCSSPLLFKVSEWRIKKSYGKKCQARSSYTQPRSQTLEYIGWRVGDGRETPACTGYPSGSCLIRVAGRWRFPDDVFRN